MAPRFDLSNCNTCVKGNLAITRNVVVKAGAKPDVMCGGSPSSAIAAGV